MKKIAIIYSFSSQKTARAAKNITEAINVPVNEIDADHVTGSDFMGYNYFILGVPTWFDGELPYYWDEFIPELEELDLTGKKFALFGNGDQKGYPENFLDALGILAEWIEKQKGQLVGFTSAADYDFESSKALRENKLCGLGLDFENQARLNKSRIENWVKQIMKEFEL
jgi:flavodoxin I